MGRTGVELSELYSFNGGGGGRWDGKSPAEWLANEPEPRRLCLVGMADRYYNGTATGAEIITLELSADELREQLTQLLDTYARPAWRESAPLREVVEKIADVQHLSRRFD